MEEVKLKIDALKHLEVGFIGLGVMVIKWQPGQRKQASAFQFTTEVVMCLRNGLKILEVKTLANHLS